jgi:hypothetical protein
MALDGHKVRLRTGNKENYIIFNGQEFVFQNGIIASVHDAPSEGWEVYKQKKLVELKCFYITEGNYLFTINDKKDREIPYTIKDGKIFIEVTE